MTDPGFQAQLDELQRTQVDQAAEQREQAIEQDAQAGVQKRQAITQAAQGELARELSDWSGGFFWIVALFGLMFGFLIGVIFTQWASYNGWWGQQCFWGLPC